MIEKVIPLKIVLCREGAVVPSYAHLGDSGMDLHVCEDVVIEPMSRKIIPTGLQAEIPPGYELQIRPRSGIAANTPLTVHFGTVDSCYRGEIGIIVENTTVFSQGIKQGIRLAQMVLCPVIRASIEVVDSLSDTSRGAGGFGSTGHGA